MFGYLYGLYVPLFKLNVIREIYNFKIGFYIGGEPNVFKFFNNIFAHSMYLFAIYIGQYEQFVISISAAIFFID